MSFTSLHGRRLGIGRQNELQSNGIAITRPCVDASITVGAENTNVRIITVQLKDARGDDIDYVENFEIHMFLNAAMTSYVATGGSTGLAIGTDGALLALVAKKIFVATSESDGDWDGTWTDTGNEAAYMAIKLPNGRMIVSDALTNAT